ESDEARFGPLQLHDISSRISLSRSRVELEQFVAESDVGKLLVSGEVLLQQPDFPISFEGELALNSGKPQGALRASNLKVSVRGTRKEPKTTMIVTDSLNETILSGRIHHKSGKWQFVTDGVDQVPRVDFAFVPEGISAEVIHAQQLWLALTYPTALHEYLPFLDVHADFEGGSLSGRFNLAATVDSTAELPTALSQIRKAALRGSYVRPEQAPLVLLGGWEIAADKNLAGTFDLAVESDRIDVREMRLADFATMAGVVWPKDSEIDLDLEIHGIPLEQLPIHIPILEKARIHGTIAGYVHVGGALDMPTWTADLSLVDGEALGVSDYWSTVELEGFGSRCDVRQFIFGRDIGRVFSATGHLDWETDSVELTASSGERVADEILQTLTSHGGWLDGLLNTRAVISGRLSDPTVNAMLSVYQGHILQDISFDTLTAQVNWDFDRDGQRRIRIPIARMERTGRYSLQGYLETNPFPGGQFAGEITGEGEFLCILEELAGGFRSHKGDGTLRARIGGTWDNPQFLGAELSLTDGKFTFTDITPNSVETSLKMRLSPGGVLEYGQLNFHSGSHQLTIRSLTDSVSTMAANLMPIHIKNPAVNLGVIEISTFENGMPLRFPGFMAPDWVGNFTFGSPVTPAVTLSWEENHLVIQGDAAFHNATVTFPFLQGSGRPSRFARWLLNLLTEARWNLRVVPEEGNHYYAKFTGLKDSDLFADWQDSQLWRNFADLIDRLDVDAEINSSQQGVLLEGRISEESFHGIGRLTSLRGTVDYLDQTFHIEEVVAEFDASDPRPIMSGRAETTGQDTLGRQIPVYLTLYVIDRETGIRAREGRLDELTVVLETDYESSPEQVLALLGYSVNDMSGQAWRVGGAIMERALRARVLRPFERRIERWTGLDVLSVAPTLQSRYRSRRGSTTPADTLEQSFGFRYFTGSQLTVGKYLTRDLFFSYTGELAEAEEVGLEGKRLGLVHFWTMEFRMRPISRDLVMDFSFEYDDLERKQDESVSLKYVFALEP
ncbi:translocation/assembly module TamB, partial [bacterium]|nr:translocation/assembly module TamB [bacterium]